MIVKWSFIFLILISAFAFANERPLKRKYVFEGEKAKDLYPNIKLVGCKNCEDDLKRIELISINEKIKDGLIVIYLFKNNEPNAQYYIPGLGTKGQIQISKIVKWLVDQKDKNKYLKTYYEVDIDEFINLDQNIDFTFNNNRNQLHSDLRNIEREKLISFQNFVKGGKFIKVNIETTDSIYVLYNPEDEIDPLELDKYKKISETAAIKDMDSKEEKSLSDYFPKLISASKNTNLKPSKHLYSSDKELLADTLAVKDNKNQEVKKYSLWHKYENFPDIVYINTESEDKKKDLEVSIHNKKDIKISTSNITYSKNKDRIPSRVYAFKKPKVLIPIYVNGKKVKNEKALVSTRYENKVVNLKDEKGGDGVQAVNNKSTVITLGWLLAITLLIG